MPSIVTAAEVSDFMSSSAVRATYDDNNDGNIDTNSLNLIIDTSEGLFLATIRGIYAIPPVGYTYDAFAKAIVLQIIHCQSIKRCPEVFRQGTLVCDDVKDLLKQLRDQDIQLDLPLLTGAQGPDAYSGEPRGYDCLEPHRRQ